MAKTYVRIYGPPLMKALQALEGVAVNISKEKEIKFSHKCIPYPTRLQKDDISWQNYLNTLKNTYVDCYEPQKIIADAKQIVGENDFMFEWVEKKPTLKQLENLIERIDNALSELGVLYTIKTD